MKIFLVILYLVCTIGSTVRAQIPDLPKSVLSPNAAGIGLYGEIPVSGFTGTPEIAIPLYTINVGDFTIPISVSYHASGVRPDQHPGWVGMGWNVNAGGLISRTVKGMPDDCNANFPGLKGVGYYFGSGALATSQWNSLDYLTSLAQDRGDADFEPDEFDFNFLGYQGKFMLNPDKTWGVQCDKPIKVEFSGAWMKVPFSYEGTAFQYVGYSQSFDGFTLTAEDGTKYIFGKEANAIEYSIGFFSQATETWVATAWHLTKIILTDGQEITYSYDRGDFINQMYISMNDDLGLKK